MTFHHSLHTSGNDHRDEDSTGPATRLHLNVTFDRNDLIALKAFVRRYHNTTKLLGPDGEGHDVPFDDTEEFLRLLVACTDRQTGLLVLEGETTKKLNSWERAELAEHVDLATKAGRPGAAVSEDDSREALGDDDLPNCYEVWSEGGSTYFGRFDSYEEAAERTRKARRQGIPAVLCETQRQFIPV